MTGIIHEDRNRSALPVVYANYTHGRVDYSSRLTGAVAPEHSDSSIRLHVAAIVSEACLSVSDADPRFLHSSSRRADSLHDLVQGSLLPLRYLIVIFVNDGPRVRMRSDEHYITDIVHSRDALSNKIHLRLTKRSPQI